MSTSFKQFEYCCLCKISHKKRKKHIYSKHHQETLSNILKKFKNKISACVSALTTVEVFGLGWELGAKFWCYFCEAEFAKHTILEDCTVKNGGLLQHISSPEHLVKMDDFFWKNFIDKKMKSKFVLKENDLEKFHNAQTIAVDNYRQVVQAKRQQEAENIRRQEWKRRQILNQRRVLSTKTYAHNKPNSFNQSKSKSANAVPRGKATAAAFGDGLSFVTHKEIDADEGNIYTDAVPPWLKDDVDISKKDEIGPSIDEYEKELKREKKRKLPDTRVGINFDRNTQSEKDWLPSFGRVWNKGRRLNSKFQFQRSMRKNVDRGNNNYLHPATNSIPMTAHTSQLENKHLQGYVSKRTATVTTTSYDEQLDSASVFNDSYSSGTNNGWKESKLERDSTSSSFSNSSGQNGYMSEAGQVFPESRTFVTYKKKKVNSEESRSDLLSQLIPTPVLSSDLSTIPTPVLSSSKLV